MTYCVHVLLLRSGKQTTAVFECPKKGMMLVQECCVACLVMDHYGMSIKSEEDCCREYAHSHSAYHCRPDIFSCLQACLDFGLETFL